MNIAFNLLDEPWLPVRLSDGQVRDLGLLEVFQRVGDITALAETAPPSLIAQHRLLLAIVHRVLTASQGRWKDSDRKRWFLEGLPVATITDYLERWRDRFWLFHPQQPFMQVAALAQADETRDKLKPWTQISLASANGNTPVVFDHHCDAEPSALDAAQAIRALLGFLQFTPGGLVKIFRDSDKAGPLANTAAVLPLGETLMQTLCLGLHPPAGADVDDAPTWERPPLTVARLRGDPTHATGPNDRYTRLTRAVLLQPDDDGKVRWIRFAAGEALADDAQVPDPMASYRMGTNGPVRLSFTEGRVFWRDLPALLPDAAGQAAKPAAVLGTATNLNELLGRAGQPLLVAGLASDQAKLLRWRADRLFLPSTLLTSPDCAQLLRMQVRLAEDLFTDLRKIATGMYADLQPDSGNKDTWARARAMFDAGPPTAVYFASAERTLERLMTLLSQGEIEQADACWSQALLNAAQAAWRAACAGLGRSSRALLAEVRAHPRLLRRLKPLRGDQERLFALEEAQQ
ncbi:type I-E CRISPR-associated protein Cse1/CasA [Chitiniphilus shinanonensis]|uniref:type I-E CRISPR-associated protein Cse1/CasA n=1 Tax=Chitiniphilus shinanonensis TaxID=553088 RepID=UPI00304CCA8A